MDINLTRRRKEKGVSVQLEKYFSGSVTSMDRNSTLVSWASDIEGEESVCRRIRVQILQVLT